MRGMASSTLNGAANGQAILVLVALRRVTPTLDLVARVTEFPDRCGERVTYFASEFFGGMPLAIEQERDQFVGLALMAER